ncbi:MAG: hypothetical protein INF43_02360 [Alphaproteobacteria bacterium]|nr:hypothetical protein [Alphaproteobacteria bacterium]
MPVVPLAAASLVLMAVSLCGMWLYDFLQTPSPVTVAQPAANPFSALVDLRQRHAQAQELTQREPRQVTLPNTPPLQVLGNSQGRVTLTLLIDPASAASRRQLAGWLALSLPDVRVELRYAPADASLAGGVVLQLAQRFGKAPLLWQALQEQRDDLDDTTLLALLAARGIALTELRDALADVNSPLLRNAQAAAAWAKQNSLTPPLALVDNLVVDGTVLQPALLDVYLQRRLAGEALIRADDYLLMRK